MRTQLALHLIGALLPFVFISCLQSPFTRTSGLDSLPESSLSRASFLAVLATLPCAASASENRTDSADGNVLKESISGVIAGSALTVAKTVVKYPLDTATVRLQMPRSGYSVFDPVSLFEGSYRGVLPPLIANVPAASVFFGVKDALKPILAFTDLPGWAKTALAVAAAQFPYWLVRNPSEVVKTRQQAGLEGFGDDVSAIEAYRKVREDAMIQNNSTTGLEGFYVGYWENIFYAYPADVIKFVIYELAAGGRKNFSPVEGAIAGALSTAAAQFLTTPLDVVRNRVMAEKGITQIETGGKLVLYVRALQQLARDEGVPGLFAGASPRVGKAFLSGAIQFATYEETKQELAKLFRSPRK